MPTAKTAKPTTKKTLNEKIADLDAKVDWFYGEDFSLSEATTKYKEALKLAEDIEQDLQNLKNEIEVIDKDFQED